METKMREALDKYFEMEFCCTVGGTHEDLTKHVKNLLENHWDFNWNETQASRIHFVSLDVGMTDGLERFIYNNDVVCERCMFGNIGRDKIVRFISGAEDKMKLLEAYAVCGVRFVHTLTLADFNEWFGDYKFCEPSDTYMYVFQIVSSVCQQADNLNEFPNIVNWVAHMILHQLYYDDCTAVYLLKVVNIMLKQRFHVDKLDIDSLIHVCNDVNDMIKEGYVEKELANTLNECISYLKV